MSRADLLGFQTGKLVDSANSASLKAILSCPGAIAFNNIRSLRKSHPFLKDYRFSKVASHAVRGRFTLAYMASFISTFVLVLGRFYLAYMAKSSDCLNLFAGVCGSRSL